MKMIITLLFLATAVMNTCTGQQPVGQFDSHSDIGKVLHPGSASYDAATQEYTVAGAGSDIWQQRDEFHFVWKKMKGNFLVTATAEFIGKGVESHRKFGWMIRSNLDSNSAHVNGMIHGDGLTSLQFRRQTAATTEAINAPINGANTVQLERKGNTIILSVAKPGELFQTREISDISLGDEVYVGLFVCSHNKDVVEKAVFRNVRIVIPAKDDFVPYRQYIGSYLETMDVATGHRKIVYQSPKSLQAPNWTPDATSLIYNSEGLIYSFDLASKKPVVVNTGSITRNNNDHVISFDGKMLGLSSSVTEDSNRSNVFVVPIQGGTPRRVTPRGLSYLHGWSPDGKSMIYTAQRNGNFDIYRIPSEGGAETRLTTSPALDDGSEYSPDGKYIYFNSARTGLMQLWRMKPDGSAQEQLTTDSLNNWFPHVSPDGKMIAFISFPKEVPADDHPFYKHVYLRLMPANGGTSKVIAYLYGGQGTINTPSWSPDSKQIAFVSNTDGIQ